MFCSWIKFQRFRSFDPWALEEKIQKGSLSFLLYRINKRETLDAVLDHEYSLIETLLVFNF